MLAFEFFSTYFIVNKHKKKPIYKTKKDTKSDFSGASERIKGPFFNWMLEQHYYTWRHNGHLGVRNNEKAAMLVFQTSPVGVELFS